MRGCTGLAAMGMVLLLASPAAALERRPGAGESKRQKARSAPAPRPAFITAPAQRPNLAERRIVELTAPPASELRTRETVSVADNIDFGVGLYTVVGETEKKSMRRRTDPRLDTGGADTRVAAIGLRLRF